MQETKTINLTVNGEQMTSTVPVRQNLVDYLRNTLGLTGSHVGCEHGVCGACTLEVDGAMIRGCLMLAVQADGAQVTTIEGLAEIGRGGGSEAGLFRSQRAAMWLLHAGYAGQCSRIYRRRWARGPRSDPRTSVGELLPLHRLSVDCRCGLRRH